jgi:4,4'-diaponeurosporenoate glycosyltransferase
VSTTAIVVVVCGLGAATWLLWRIPVPILDGEPFDARFVSIVVPARNEAAVLPRLLDSIARQQDSPAEVLVVDDGSTDETAATAAAHGANVVAAPPLPAGWLGKPWACRTGAARAAGTTIVFLDADVELGPDGLAALLAAHRRLTPEGLLSVQPFHVTRRAHEQLSACCNLVSMLASGAFTPRAPRSASVAFGPCLVTSADAYARVGGHDAVAGEVTEDLALARAYRASAFTVMCLAGGPSVSFRMYPGGLRDLRDGWVKNLAAGARGAPVLPALGATLWVAAAATVAVSIVAAAWDPSRLPVAAIAWAVVALHLAWMLARIGRFRWWTSAAFPLPLFAFIVFFAWSVAARVTGGPVRWRGRDVAGGGR